MTSSQTAQNSVDHAGLSRQILDELFDIEAIHPTGSSFTCDPPVLDTDIDFVCKVPNIEEFYDYALENGWESSTELPARRNGPTHAGALTMAPPAIMPRPLRVPYAIGDFISFRRGNINLIVTQKRGFFDRYLKATMLAKEFNLLDKDHRIKLFTAIVGQQREAEIT